MSISHETLQLQAEIDRMMREVTDAQAQQLQAAWGQAWDALREDLVRAVAETLATTGRITLAMLRRNRRLTRVVQQVIDRLELVVAASERATVAGLRGLVDTAIAAQQSILDSQLPPGFDLTQLARWSRVDQRQVDAMVLRATERIHSLNRPLVPTAVAAMKRELVRGVTVGSNPRVTARRIVARAGEAGFGGGLTRAMTIARTETLDAYREAGRIAQEPHSDVLDGWTWLASLTPRTCPACLSMHGREFEQSVPGPQGHQNCRCSRLPRLKSWAELGIEGMDDEPDDEVPDADKFFAGLTPAQKQAMLGKRGYQAWLAGDWDRAQWAVKRKSAGWRDSWVNAKSPASAAGDGAGDGDGDGPVLPDLVEWDPADGPLPPITKADLEKVMEGLERRPGKWNGGHGWDRRRPSKTEFPSTWTSEHVKFVTEQTMLAAHHRLQSGDMQEARRVWDGVLVFVQWYYPPSGGVRFRASYPKCGTGVVRNTPDGDRLLVPLDLEMLRG